MSDPLVPVLITHVVVYEDRAEVTREAIIELPEGEARYRIAGLSPLVSERHLVVRLEAIDGGALEARVDDLRLRREWRDGGAARVALQLTAAEDEQSAAERAFAWSNERSQALHRLYLRYCHELSRSMWANGAEKATYEGELDAFSAALAGAVTTLDQSRRQVREACHRVDVLRSLHQTGRERPSLVVELALQISNQGPARRKARLIVSTWLPCAGWRPAHEAHLVADRLRWTTLGTVWQCTGEDWNEAQIVLSTARPGSEASLPELTAERLRVESLGRAKRETFVEEREELGRDLRELRGPAPGIYDGGEERRYVALGPSTIPDDGRPHRVFLDSFEAVAQVELAAVPEMASYVFSRVVARNASSQPLLAGPVILRKQGAYLGVGDVDFTERGDQLEISLGSDDRFSVRLERRRLVDPMPEGGERVHFVTVVELSHCDEGLVPVEVVLRLPVSGVDELLVVPSEQYCSEGPPEPDERGFVRLPIALEPGAPRRVSIGFSFEKSGPVKAPTPWR